jgi:hypothetical protein
MIVSDVIGLTRCQSSLRALAVITHSALRAVGYPIILSLIDQS